MPTSRCGALARTTRLTGVYAALLLAPMRSRRSGIADVTDVVTTRSDRTTEEYDSEDTYELYAIASWDVLLAPTLSYYQDMDAIEGGFATFGVSHSYPMGEKASLDFSAAVSFDFGYNLGEGVAADYGLEESNGDLNDVLIGLDVPVQVTDWFGFHVMVQQSIALDVLDDLEVDDETVFTGGVTFSF